MKKVKYRKITNPKKGRKSLAISQRTEDKAAVTHIRKKFIYIVSRTKALNPQNNPPQIFIRKAICTKRGIEIFSFRVKGTFYTTHKRSFFKVRYQHVLNIRIYEKRKNLSPKESVVLT